MSMFGASTIEDPITLVLEAASATASTIGFALKDATQNLPPAGVLQVGSEKILYRGVSLDGLQIVDCQRGYADFDALARTHEKTIQLEEKKAELLRRIRAGEVKDLKQLYDEAAKFEVQTGQALGKALVDLASVFVFSTERTNALAEAKENARLVAEGYTITVGDLKEALKIFAATRGYSKTMINVNEAVNFFGPDTPVSKITTEEVDHYVLFLEGPERRNSDATINRKLSALSVMLTLAHKRKKLTTLPEFTRKKEREGRIRFLTADEERKLIGWITHIGKTDHTEACIVLIDTGFRCSELWGLSAHNVNLTNRTLTLWKTKADKPRTVPMTKRVFDIIERRCDTYPTGQLFPGSSNEWMSNVWKRVRVLMGMVAPQRAQSWTATKPSTSLLPTSRPIATLRLPFGYRLTTLCSA